MEIRHFVDSEEVVTITQAEQIAKITRRTLYNWLNAGEIKNIKDGGQNYILKNSLLEKIA